MMVDMLAYILKRGELQIEEKHVGIGLKGRRALKK
jgi:hypothetical protein